MIQSFSVSIAPVASDAIEPSILDQLPAGAELVRWAIVEALTDTQPWLVEGAYYLKPVVKD